MIRKKINTSTSTFSPTELASYLKLKYRSAAVLCLLLLSAGTAGAQTVYDLVVGGSAVSQTIHLTNPGGGSNLTNPTIDVLLASGVNMVPGSLVSTSGLSTGATLGVMGGGSLNAFSVKLTGVFPAGETLSITFTRTAGCSAVSGPPQTDKATVQSVPSINSSVLYQIWEPILSIQSLVAASTSAIAGQGVGFTSAIENTGQHSYISDFRLNIQHTGFDAPTNIQVQVGASPKFSIPAANIVTNGAGTITSVLLSSSILSSAGKTNGKLSFNDRITLFYTAAPKIAECGKLVNMKVGTETIVAGASCKTLVYAGAPCNVDVKSPGFVLDVFSALRQNYDQPDAAEMGSANGAWIWASGSASPMRNYVRNGDAMEFSMQGTIYTSSLFPQADHLYATIKFGDGKYGDFIWNPSLTVRIKKYGAGSWDTYHLMADPYLGTDFVRYKVDAPGGMMLTTGDQVELVATATMKDAVKTSGSSILSAEAFAVYATESIANRYPIAPSLCKKEIDQPITRIPVTDTLFINNPSMVGSCTPVSTTLTFESEYNKGLPSYVGVGNGPFTQEVRSNHFVKELQVYIPAGGHLASGNVTINGLLSTLALTTPTVVTFNDGSKTYPGAQCYTFDLSGYYIASSFTDELKHVVKATFNISFDSPVASVAENLAIKYVAVPANQSFPGTPLPAKSVVQAVSVKCIWPELSIVSPPGDAIVITPAGTATWRLKIENTHAGAANLDNLKLQLDNLTGGSFSSIVVKQDGVVVPVASGVATLSSIVAGTQAYIDIEAVVSEACNAVERLKASLLYPPCVGTPVQLAAVEVSYKAPTSSVQVSSTIIGGTTLGMCQDFLVDMVISSATGTVKSPQAVLQLPVNSGGLLGISYVEIVNYPGKNPDAGLSTTDRLVFDLFDVAGITQLTAGQSVTLQVKLKPTCDFPIGAKLTSFAYGKNFCTSFNSQGSGQAVYTNELSILGLQSAYTAQVQFGVTSLQFEKSDILKSCTLLVKKTGGAGSIGVDDKVSISMPVAFKLAADPTLGGVPVSSVTETFTGSGATQRIVLSWTASPAIAGTNGATYTLNFKMDQAPTYTDVLDGTFNAMLINKVPGLVCGGSTCPSMETKAGEASLPFRILDIFPAVAKSVTFTSNSLMDFNFVYTFTLKNFGTLPIENVRLYDNMASFYSKGTVRNISLSASSTNLLCNTAFSGQADTLLLRAGSRLLPGETQTVTLRFSIRFNDALKNTTFTIPNSALLIGSNENDTDYSDKSNNGTTPNPTDDTPTVTDPIDTHVPEVVIVPVIAGNPPAGFAITADGVECFEGNAGNTPLEFEYKLKNGQPLDYDLCFTTYTRDDVATVADNDYEPLQPVVLCIRAGKTSAERTVTINIVGDTKYEKDEPFTLEVKPGANPMTCNPVRINILNDDALPNIYIDDITLDGSKGPVPAVADFSKLEGTSTTIRTKFTYRIRLNMPAPQPLVVRVIPGGSADNATLGRDYYVPGGYIDIPIATGASFVDLILDVEPDAIPENDEVFTLSFSLRVQGETNAFQQVANKTLIIDDDAFSNPYANIEVVYCPGDDAATQFTKLNQAITASTPSGGYTPNWYATATTAQTTSVPTVTTDVAGVTHAPYWIGWYNAVEDYEVPIGQRSVVEIKTQASPASLDITATPALATPVQLLPGQNMVFTVYPSNMAAYSYTLNGKPLAGGKNELLVYRSKLEEQNHLIYTVTDEHGCLWSKTLDVEVQQKDMPNAFIPEGPNPDNKVFLKSFDIRVFNRWGHELYQGTEGWDGRYKGSYVSPGTYYYVLNQKNEDGSVSQIKGVVVVVSAGSTK